MKTPYELAKELVAADDAVEKAKDNICNSTGPIEEKLEVLRKAMDLKHMFSKSHELSNANVDIARELLVAQKQRNDMMLELDDLQCCIASAAGWEMYGESFGQFVTRIARELASYKETEQLRALIDGHPPTDQCPDMECTVCSVRDCPGGEPLHYHHDGCPICSFPTNSPPPRSSSKQLDDLQNEGDDLLTVIP